MPEWQVICGDCLEVMRGMDAGSIDAVVTDPPYSGGGMFRGDRDCVLFTFDPGDCANVYLLPFQHLRMAFRRHCSEWSVVYDRKKQSSGTWQSECVFVPVPCVLDAVVEVMGYDPRG
jgi:hypothetical protein